MKNDHAFDRFYTCLKSSIFTFSLEESYGFAIFSINSSKY